MRRIRVYYEYGDYLIQELKGCDDHSGDGKYRSLGEWVTLYKCFHPASAIAMAKEFLKEENKPSVVWDSKDFI